MDRTRDYDIERDARIKIGNAIRSARQDNNMTLADVACSVGGTQEGISQVEDGQKTMNLIRFLQHVATIGGKVEVVSANGQRYDITAPPFTDKQKGTRQQIREDTQRREEALRWARSFDTPDGQKTDTPADKKRRPRLPRP